MLTSSRCKIAALLLTLTLVAPWAAAAEPRTENTRTPRDLIARLWTALTETWVEEGCRIDPYGSCREGSATPTPTENLDEGCKMDPYGGCREGS